MAVVVVVAPGNAFHVAELRHAHFFGHVSECAVVVVVEELRAFGIFDAGFMADEDVEPAVVIVVGEGGGLGGVGRH
jgi:hypothetical protein